MFLLVDGEWHPVLSEAVERTIAALESTGRLEEVDAALVAACRMLAQQIDLEPNDRLWREFRAYEAQLRLSGVGKGDDAVSILLARLQAPVGYPQDGESSDPR